MNQPPNSTASTHTDRAILLLLLNGLTRDQIAGLTPADVDVAQRWVHVADGFIPLSTQCADALSQLPPEPGPTCFSPQTLAAAFDRLPLSEAEAHARLAGALWFTSDDGRLIREAGGFTAEQPILPLAYTYPFSLIGRLQPDSPAAAAAQATVQTAVDWLSVELLGEQRPSRIARIRKLLFSGHVLFLLSSTGVNGVNFLYNLVIGRLLTPAEYGQITLLITLQLILSLIPGAIQTVSARFSATYAAREDYAALAALFTFGRRWSLRIGIAACALLIVGALPLAALFQIARPELLLPIVIATPLFVMTGIDRGVLQGTGSYFWLSGAYLAEGIIRFAVGVGMALIVASSARIDGAAWGLGQAMLLTWFVSWLGMRHVRLARPPMPAADQPDWLRLLSFVTLGLVGQALITNSDFMLVKLFFSPEDAGHYAAVTVLGRIAYFGATPLILLMLPAVARHQALGQPTRPILLRLSGLVGLFTGGLFVVSWLFAPQILSLLYGEAYLPAASLLPLYTIAASLFVFVNLAMTYLVALNAGGGASLLLIAGIAQIAGILLFHDTLLTVVIVQIVIMLLLVIAVGWQTIRRTDRVTIP